ncbi:hypothetical protein V6N13_149011 [Hibiscus sabdariffa]|uniref:Uncharacterized protein n=1 Tax=Hibiscus sabdariffa TaxID=183260 RepID=A0ABR2EMD3_9ROSI
MLVEGVFEFQFGAWLKVDSKISKLDGVRRPKSGDRGKGIGVNPSKVACSKRTHSQKDADGLALISK